MEIKSVKDVEWLMQLALEPVSLNKVMCVDGDGETEFGDSIADTAPGPEELVMSSMTASELLNKVNKLPAREAMVIRLRYGFEDGEIKTLEEVGEIFGVTRERIRQVEAKAIRMLKKTCLAFKKGGSNVE